MYIYTWSGKRHYVRTCIGRCTFKILAHNSVLHLSAQKQFNILGNTLIPLFITFLIVYVLNK